MARSDPAWLEEFERDPRGGGRVGGGGFTRVLLALEDLFDKEDGVGEGEGDGEGEGEEGGGGRLEGDGLMLLWIGGCEGDQGASVEGERG